METPVSRHEQAAHWYLRMREADVGVDEIDQAMAWLAQSPENRAAFDRVEKFWQASEAAKTQHLRDFAASGAQQSEGAVEIRRRPVLKGLLAAGIAALLATAAGPQIKEMLGQSTPARYTTMVGEMRVVSLPDGSQITLGGASSVSVEYGRDVRRIMLIDGEALFQVAKNPQRPFVVEAAGASVQALGTVFDVHREPEGVTVKVAEGLVQVSAGQVAPVRLQAGNQVTYSPLAGLGPLRTVDPNRVASWRKGLLVFIDRPLASVIVDLNRYSPRPISVADDSIRQVRVTGTVSVDGINEWLQGLKETAAIEVEEGGHDLVLYRAKG